MQVRGDLCAGVNDCARGAELAQPQDVIGVLADIAAVDRFPARGAPRQIEPRNGLERDESILGYQGSPSTTRRPPITNA